MYALSLPHAFTISPWLISYGNQADSQSNREYKTRNLQIDPPKNMNFCHFSSPNITIFVCFLYFGFTFCLDRDV